MTRLRVVLFTVLVGSVPGFAFAQINAPLSGFVVDVRGVWARFKEDEVIASILGVSPVNLPTRGFGIAVAAPGVPARTR